MASFITIETYNDLIGAYKNGHTGAGCVFSPDFNKTQILGARAANDLHFYDFIQNLVDSTLNNAPMGMSAKTDFIGGVLCDIGEHMQFRDAENVLFYGMRGDVFRSGSVGGCIIQNLKRRVGRYRGDGFTMESFVGIGPQIVYALINLGFDNVIFNFGRDHFSDTNPLHRYLLDVSEKLTAAGYENFAPVALRWAADGEYMAMQRTAAAQRKKQLKAKRRGGDGEFWRQKRAKK